MLRRFDPIAFSKGARAISKPLLRTPFSALKSNTLTRNVFNSHSSLSIVTFSRGYSQFTPLTPNAPNLNNSNFNNSNSNNDKDNNNSGKSRSKTFTMLLIAWTAVSTLGLLYFLTKEWFREASQGSEAKKLFLLAFISQEPTADTENFLRNLLNINSQMEKPDYFADIAVLFGGEDKAVYFHNIVLEKIVLVYLIKKDYTSAEKYVNQRAILINDPRFQDDTKEEAQISIFRQKIELYMSTKNRTKLQETMTNMLRVMENSLPIRQSRNQYDEVYASMAFTFLKYGKFSEAEYYAKKVVENYDPAQRVSQPSELKFLVHMTGMLLELYFYQGNSEKFVELMETFTDYSHAKEKAILEFFATIEKDGSPFFYLGKINEFHILLDRMEDLAKSLNLDSEKERRVFLNMDNLRSCGFARKRKLETARKIMDDVATRVKTWREIPLSLSKYMSTGFVNIESVANDEKRYQINLKLIENELQDDVAVPNLPIGSVLVAKFPNPNGGTEPLVSKTVYYKKADRNAIDLYSDPFKVSNSKKNKFHVVEVLVYNSDESKLLSTHYQICGDKKKEVEYPKWTKKPL
eukprot:TRINITY_DN2604_c0_g1_i1.p1 TRINITY_DN2604_c0_g1~~TRINITY_DN2604_c0_g1_i1.p1  ORF type:complete len:577 (-),score=104.07 TRINITY_DN2604_c0_g1_i1:139-1869(-)